MKTHYLPSFIAIGALLPLAAWGGDTRSQTTIHREAYDPRPSETRSGPPTPRVEETRGQVSEQPSTEITESRSLPASTATAATATGTGIECVSPSQAEQSVTARSLIGTKVVDREGQEVGKVKDIGLTSVAPQLASQSETEHDRSIRASTGLSRPSSQSGATKEARVFVRPVRALDAGDALVAIPATQLHREGDDLRLDLSREEIRALVAEREAGRVSMSE